MLPAAMPRWKSDDDFYDDFKTALKRKHLRAISERCRKLATMRFIAQTAGGLEDVEKELSSVLSDFMKYKESGEGMKQAEGPGRWREKVLDEQGRSFTQGFRKTAKAKVWMIQAKEAVPWLPSLSEQKAVMSAVPTPLLTALVEEEGTGQAVPATATKEDDIVVDLVSVSSEDTSATIASTSDSPAPVPTTASESVFFPTSSESASSPSASSASSPSPTTTTPLPLNLGQVLINNMPLHRFFPLIKDREQVVRPFRLAGLLGAFNVFALVEGGGDNVRAGAVQMAIVRGLCTFYGEPMKKLFDEGEQIEIKNTRTMLTDTSCDATAGMYFRDYRHRERKKTNQPGAKAKVREYFAFETRAVNHLLNSSPLFLKYRTPGRSVERAFDQSPRSEMVYAYLRDPYEIILELLKVASHVSVKSFISHIGVIDSISADCDQSPLDRSQSARDFVNHVSGFPVSFSKTASRTYKQTNYSTAIPLASAHPCECPPL